MRVVPLCTILTSSVFSLGALICLVIVGLACTSRGGPKLRALDFLQINTYNLTENNSTNGGVIWEALVTARHRGKLADWYSIGMLGYCAGDEGNKTAHTCIKPRPGYWFDLLAIGGTDDKAEEKLPSSLRRSMGRYKNSTQWMQILYILATGLTTVQLLGAVVSVIRSGNGAVTVHGWLLSGIAFLFTLVAAALITVNFVLLRGIIATELKLLGLTAIWGVPVFIVLWLGLALSFVTLIGWTLIACCCQGDRRQAPGGGYAPAETIATPLLHPSVQPQQYSLRPMAPASPGTAYEPYRHG
ncbi:hypothetical protein BO82DRAFT_392736 [Aspergillus uvarum CBS 121591]|uniref:Integral membrane protein n=1 Tax=Aspergillus uvarum CBS 121591 TaxID=1448315 RepID=A0A319CZH0_9EURO|nr:hypothetical protein BO82DRAFT_392736 [Aspergillus uvarum CBS 121591]PYH81058.1 hypothetical protein BO82DRAFT_392736 [Aspergillus uvarum CBS 121591]